MTRQRTAPAIGPFGTLIEAMIDENGGTQGQFANRVGVHYTLISHYLAGRRLPRWDVVHKIVAAYPERKQDVLDALFESSKEGQPP